MQFITTVSKQIYRLQRADDGFTAKQQTKRQLSTRVLSIGLHPVRIRVIAVASSWKPRLLAVA